ncbi:digestive cysteine proteinase 1-like [Rhynchophorus ferrugineus]|uniref:digestive cysteine proteinase 1-like n=1 Tax=Rhynchophorus ferrugineus TaxID=354439 RepID=UPI003FCE8F60
MKCLLIVVALVLAVSASSELSVAGRWSEFKLKHTKSYQDKVEETKRFAIFQNNLKKIEEHNARYETGEETYQMGITKFADMTSEEFGAMLRASYKRKPGTRAVYQAPADADIPASFDWRPKGVLNAVKDQGSCGSCWAFGSIAVVESALAIKTGNLLSLSEQQLVDCARGGIYFSEGCDGGYFQDALDYVSKNGVDSEAAYPYKGVDQACRPSGNPAGKIANWTDITPNNENDLANLVVTVGPIGVSLYAEPIQFYYKGIYTGYCIDSVEFVDHAVTAVGYGSEDGVDYWIIRNSWGDDWGEDGHFRIQRGVNKCAIANEAAYVIV